MDEALALRAIRSVLLVTLPTEYAWSWDFGSWERGPEGVGESRFGDISQTPPPRGGGREVTIWLGPSTQSGGSMVEEAAVTWEA